MKQSLLLCLYFGFAITVTAQSPVPVVITCSPRSIKPAEVPPGSIVKFQIVHGDCDLAYSKIVCEIQELGNVENAPGVPISIPRDATVSLSNGTETLFIGDLKIVSPPPPVFPTNATPRILPAKPTNPAVVKPATNPKERKLTQPVFDALLLDSLWLKKDFEAVEYLLTEWKITREDCKSILYLKDYAMVFDPSTIKAQSASGTETPATGALSSLFSPTIIIDGLARFAVERFKQELTIAYLEGFKEKLGKYEELQTMLPGTFRTLLNEDYFNYPVFIPSLRENAFNDMQEFPRNMKSLLRDKKQDVDKKVFPLLMSACDLIQSVRIAQPPSAILENLAFEDYIIDDPTDYGKIVRIIGAFSRNLHSWEKNPTPTGWATPQEINRVLAHPHAFNFWMGIMMKNESEKTLKQIKIKLDNGIEKSIYDLLNEDFARQNSMVRTLLYHFNMVASVANNLQFDSKTDSMHHANFGKLAIALGDLIAESGEAFKIKNETIKQCSSALHAAAQLENAIRTKQFGVALSQVLNLAQIGFPNKDWCKFLSKYGNFLVSIINAENADAVKIALDNAAAPVQSYRLKREKRSFGISLNMYPGLATGIEWSIDEMGKSGKGGFLIAPTVPVGIGADWGRKNGGSFSIFVPLIDIGAVAAFRFNDNVSALPELAWSNVIAPGFYLMWGVKKSPISVGFGGQLGPALRKVTTDDITLEQRSFRFSFNIGVDVPIFQKTKYLKPLD